MRRSLLPASSTRRAQNLHPYLTAFLGLRLAIDRLFDPLSPAFARVRVYCAVVAVTLAAAASMPDSFGAVATMDPHIVTATRTPQPLEHVAATVKIFDEDALRDAPSLTLDGMLRGVPGFSLFRRSDSLTANPTAQGVSLRGLGPSGASRSLILLDGVPLNDPFGGWVAWTKIPRESLTLVELVPGGGATAWGNSALGGVVHLITDHTWTRTTRGTATFGDFGTRSLDFTHGQPINNTHLTVSGRIFATDGFSTVAPEDRGAIDIPAWSRHRNVTARWRHRLDSDITLAGTFRAFEEKRGNGTPYQQNASREKFLSLAASGQPTGGAFAWDAVAYAQDQSFSSRFSAVNATRSAETPASNQFAVPSTAFGAAWTGAWQHAHSARSSFGVDARFVRGETREHYSFANGDFTRQRVAGGEQLVGGVFALHERPLAPRLRATFGARLDGWRETDGHRRETDRITGAVLRDDRYADRNGTAFNPSAGLVWTPADAWRIRANLQRAFRRPTLNELYRPFRVGPNITEANAALDTESVNSAELGAEWRLFRNSRSRQGGSHITQPGSFPQTGSRALLTLGATAFWNDLRDAVGNVTLVHGPGAYPLFGFVPPGGAGRQRLNIDRTRVRGIELSARWAPTPSVTIAGDFLYNDARIRRATIEPDLVGNRLAQVPRHSAALSVFWNAPWQLRFAPRIRWIGRQFEDDQNELTLGEVVVVDLGVSRPLTEQIEVFLTIENLGNARIETGRNAGGLVNTGTPRLFVAGLRGSW